MSGLPDKEHLLVSEVAEFLRCSESHVRDLAHEGELEGFRVEEVKTTYHFGRKRGQGKRVAFSEVPLKDVVIRLPTPSIWTMGYLLALQHRFGYQYKDSEPA